MTYHDMAGDGITWEALKDLGTESSKRGTNAWVKSVPATVTEMTLLASAPEQLQLHR